MRYAARRPRCDERHGSIGLGAGGTAGALLGAERVGTDAAAGLALGLVVLGSAGSATAHGWHVRSGPSPRV